MSNPDWKVVSDETGVEFVQGDTVIDFRDHAAIFNHISRTPEPGKSGKIVVDLKGWPLGEFYPQVFGLKIVKR